MMKRLLYAMMISVLLLNLAAYAPGYAGEGVGQEKVVKQLSEAFDFQKVNQPVKTAAAPSVAAEADKLQTEIILTRERNKFLSIGFLLVALMVSLYCILYFVRKTKHEAEDIVHASGLVLIIFGTIIIVLMVDVEQQLTAAIGIMGAIAGYIFGTMHRGKGEKSETPPGGSAAS